jgi:hypothetical protein
LRRTQILKEVVELCLKALEDDGKRVGSWDTALSTAEHIGEYTAYARRDDVTVNGQGTRIDARNVRQGNPDDGGRGEMRVRDP